jgi:hypothetical protein
VVLGLKASERARSRGLGSQSGQRRWDRVSPPSVLAAEDPAFSETLDKVSALLTFKAIQQMKAAVTLEEQSATSVAQQFLHANGLA